MKKIVKSYELKKMLYQYKKFKVTKFFSFVPSHRLLVAFLVVSTIRHVPHQLNSMGGAVVLDSVRLVNWCIVKHEDKLWWINFLSDSYEEVQELGRFDRLWNTVSVDQTISITYCANHCVTPPAQSEGAVQEQSSNALFQHLVVKVQDRPPKLQLKTPTGQQPKGVFYSTATAQEALLVS